MVAPSPRGRSEHYAGYGIQVPVLSAMTLTFGNLKLVAEVIQWPLG